MTLIDNGTGGTVSLMHNTATKLATTATGINVTGTATMDGLTLDAGVYKINNTSVGSGSDKWIGSDGGAGIFINAGASGNFNVYNNNSVARLGVNGSTGDISFYDDTGTSQALFWDASAESLGIGTTNPAAPLDIKLNTNSTADIFKFQRLDGAVAGVLNYSGTDGAISLGTTTSHDLTFDTANTERMRIDSSGNVGIGTSSAHYHTTNRTVLNINGTTSSLIGLEHGDTTAGYIYADSGNLQFWAEGSRNITIGMASSANVLFSTNNTERMRIQSDGLIDIGPQSGSGVGRVNISANPFNNYQIEFWNTASVSVGSITVTGGGTATAYNTSSDYRLKENVVYDWTALDRLNQLKPARFNFIASADTTVDGFLAHEVQDIVPEAIHGTKDEVNEEGNPVYQGIDHSKLVPLLTKAIQEQQVLIEQLQAEVALLKGE